MYLGWTKRGLFLTLAYLALLSPYALAASPQDLLPTELIQTYEGGDALGLRHPSDVLMTSDNRVLVLDGVSNRVVIYSADGQFQGSFGKGGQGEGELNHPLGMTLDAQDNLYIADSGNGRIQIYSSQGEYQTAFELPRDKGQKRPDPTDVAVDNERKLLYVVDNENHRVLIYGLADKDLIGSVGKMSHQGDGFRWPFSIFLDPAGTAYIVDVVNTTVRTLLPDEGFKFGMDVGRWGVEKGELFRPKGVAVNSAGEIFITDSYLGVIQVFDSRGKFRAVLGTDQGKARRFVTPTRLYFDKQGRLFVVEMFANRISVYKLGS